MKTVKSLLLGSAAGLVAFTGAQAADLPMAEPVEYVKVCSTYGEGFFYIPGTDTCLQISGKVRADFRVLDDDYSEVLTAGGTGFDIDSNAGDDFDTDVRGVIAADARSETEWGTLRAYIEFEGRARSGEYSNGRSGLDAGDYSVVGPAVELISAFVQFAGITAGYAPSFYDFAEYDSVGDFFSAEDVVTLAYTASFGSGFAATIGIEDKYFRAIPYAGGGDGLDQTWPNVIAALRVDQAWGSAQISAAVQDQEGDRLLPVGGDDIGWAVQGGIKFNLPTSVEGSYIWAQAAYSEGALSYAGAEDFTGNFENLGAFGSYGLVDQSLGINNELLLAGGGVAFQASDAVRFNLMGAWYEYDSVADDLVVDGITAEANVFWTPVDNLDLGLAVIYADYNAEDQAGVAIAEDSTWMGVLRIERGF